MSGVSPDPRIRPSANERELHLEPQTLILLIAATVCAWAALRVIGGERDRRIRDLANTIAATPPPEAPALPSTNPPVRSKAAR